jgi:hypothetical protein
MAGLPRVLFAHLRERRERKTRDVLRQPLDIRWLEFLLREHVSQNRLRVPIIQALADNAEDAKTHGGFVGIRAEQFTNNGEKQIYLGSDGFFDQRPERVRRLRHFARHKFAVPRRTAFVEHALQELADERTEALFGRGRRMLRKMLRIPLDGAGMGGFQNCRVKFAFVAEMVMNCCDLRACCLANFAHGGGVKTFFGKDLTCRFEQVPACLLTFFCNRHIQNKLDVLNTRFNQSFWCVNISFFNWTFPSFLGRRQKLVLRQT